MIKITEITSKSHKRHGHTYSGVVLQGHQAEIEPGVSIRLIGEEHNLVKGSRPFDKTFKIGDWAEYDSYNLRYDGKITAITPKTVTINAYPDSNNERNHRMSIYEFSYRNWNFDKEETDRHNSEEMMYI